MPLEWHVHFYFVIMITVNIKNEFVRLFYSTQILISPAEHFGLIFTAVTAEMQLLNIERSCITPKPAVEEGIAAVKCHSGLVFDEVD